jgi:ADP-L-glycero-D-manno-heptose 6-epimerase
MLRVSHDGTRHMTDDLVVVTGAGGFIGANIVGTLAAEGRDVVACDWFHHEDSWRYLAASLLHDIVSPDRIGRWLDVNSGRVSTIVHMGAISATTETDLTKIIENNVRSTLDLWTYCVGAGVTFIYASSAATYGDGSQGFEDNDQPDALQRLRPLNPYAWSKHLVDRRIANDVVTGRPVPPRWAGLKFFNVYGPHEGHKGGMRSLIHQIYPGAAKGQPVRLFRSDHPDYADGAQLRDFVYVKDCVAVICAMLSSPECGGLYNVGTGKARSFADLANAVFLAVDREPNIEYVDMPLNLRGRYQYFTQADTRKLVSAGFAPPFYELESGVADYVTQHLVDELG